jgi:hypothetical protein
VVVGEPVAITGDLPTLLHPQGASGNELAQSAVAAVQGAPKALGQHPSPREALRLSVGVPGQEGEPPDGTVRHRCVEQLGGDAPERVSDDPPPTHG